jgi:hypothetical protein
MTDTKGSLKPYFLMTLGGCKRSAVIITKLISMKFGIPVGYEVPGVRLCCLRFPSGSYQTVSRLSVSDIPYFVDARHSAVNPSHGDGIVFEPVDDFLHCIGAEIVNDEELRRYGNVDDADSYDFLSAFKPLVGYSFIPGFNSNGDIGIYQAPELGKILNEFL